MLPIQGLYVAGGWADTTTGMPQYVGLPLADYTSCIVHPHYKCGWYCMWMLRDAQDELMIRCLGGKDRCRLWVSPRRLGSLLNPLVKSPIDSYLLIDEPAPLQT